MKFYNKNSQFYKIQKSVGWLNIDNYIQRIALSVF